MILTIIIFLIMLSLLVFVHEAGHFLTARKLGIEVEEFGFGFPPRLWSVRRHGTVYSVNWIPLGGFVKIKGESGEHASERDSFAGRAPWQRAVVVAAGVVMNVVLAWVLLSIGFNIGLPQIIDEGLPSSARVRNQEIQVLAVLPKSPAAESGIEPGDKIKKIDGQSFSTVKDTREYIQGHSENEVELQLRRNQEDIFRKIKPMVLVETKAPGIGVSLAAVGVVSYPIHQAMWQGLALTGEFLKDIFVGIGSIFAHLFQGAPSAVEVAGPVGIAVLTGEAVSRGFAFLLQFAAVLSLNLAVVNSLPVPALDGGRLLFILIEKLRRRAVSKQLETAIHNIGFAILILLVLLVTARDIGRFGGTIGNVIRGIMTNF